MHDKLGRIIYVGIFTLLLLLYGCKSKLSDQPARFAGRQSCVECHQTEYQLWQHSDHDKAMDSATPATVLGDFNDAAFVRDGFTHKFYVRDSKYYVYTEGPAGKAGEYQVAYTFGFRPLQQYLVPFENGKFQCLPLSWDTQQGRWFHLADSVYKGQELLPDDWLYWTNSAQNWNGMCAECHSTNLRKNYDPETHIYETTWSEIDVSCEACHGPASVHNEWASIPAVRRPDVANCGLVVRTSDIGSVTLVDQCAYCHSRRSSFGDFEHPRERLFDIISPQLPMWPLYYPDGQILEEDYVYGSFMQSKMHMNKVRCTNCHDAHSLKLKRKGNDLCLQCHVKEKYDTKRHHFHKNANEAGEPLQFGDNKMVEVGEGAQCVNCHMPGKYFMGVDFRRDHSMRIPRPDLSEKIGSPNACTQCHRDKDTDWAASCTKKWYENPYRSHFGETMFLAHKADTSAIKGLTDILVTAHEAPIIRAVATQYISQYQDERLIILNRQLLHDKEAIVRREAIKAFVPEDVNDLIENLGPFLNDSLRMLRLEAVVRLSAVPPEQFNSIQKSALSRAIEEYVEVMNYSADFAASRFNLGNLYTNLGQLNAAERQYKEAIRIDKQFYPAIINLAMLYNKMQKNDRAEQLFKQLIHQFPEQVEVLYSLALLLAEMKKYDESLIYFRRASEEMPNRPRIFFNLYQLCVYKKLMTEAEMALDRCLFLEPQNMSFLTAALEFNLKIQNKEAAKSYAKQILFVNPEHENRLQIEAFIEGK